MSKPQWIWPNCSRCGDIAQEHADDGRCPQTTLTRYYPAVRSTFSLEWANGLLKQRAEVTGYPEMKITAVRGSFTGFVEYRTNFVDGKEETAYYTEDLVDAFVTALDMEYRARVLDVIEVRR